ncbi:G-protein coupled receptor 1-like isoform X1 [Bufo gargarizans]|uniref:G-protein coupled receptor 1-like isoform X1 n=2 Tax=Bufo gargarizans TaxID=30331 RepID=UPI001CF3E26D|nr:G-protein coupled receptor 1-like isoform X1 [Bufo gargarizans]
MADNCTGFGSSSQCVTITTVKRITATFSLIGCVCMLVIIWLFRKYNSLAQKMIVSLAIAAFFDSIAYVMSEVLPDGVLCNFQAWWLTYFDWCALAWVCSITLNLYLNVVKEMRTDQYQLTYHFTAWGVPFILSCLPLFGDLYGPAGAWCWITDEHVAWRFVIWYVPLFSLIFLMMLCYLRIIYVAKQRVITWSGTYDPRRERSKIIMAEEIKPLKWYPCVYLAVSLFPLLNRIHNAFYPSHPVFILTLLHVMSAPLHGLANTIVFVLDKETWSQLTMASLRVAFQSRLCDRTKITEYHPASVRYMTQIDEEDSDSADDTTVLFSMPSMALRNKEP